MEKILGLLTPSEVFELKFLTQDETLREKIHAFAYAYEDLLKEKSQIEQKVEVVSEAEGDVIKFLLGEGSLNGVWYGDPKPDNERGNFWWRKYLRDYLVQEREQTRREGIKECIKCFDALFLVPPQETVKAAEQLKNSYSEMLELLKK